MCCPYTLCVYARLQAASLAEKALSSLEIEEKADEIADALPNGFYIGRGVHYKAHNDLVSDGSLEQTDEGFSITSFGMIAKNTAEGFVMG